MCPRLVQIVSDVKKAIKIFLALLVYLDRACVEIQPWTAIHVSQNARHPEPSMFQVRFLFWQRKNRKIIFDSLNKVTFLSKNVFLIIISTLHINGAYFSLKTVVCLSLFHGFLTGRECHSQLPEMAHRVSSLQCHALHTTCTSIQVCHSSRTGHWGSIFIHLFHSVRLKTGRRSIRQWFQNLHRSVIYIRHIHLPWTHLWGGLQCFLGRELIFACKTVQRLPYFMNWTTIFQVTTYPDWQDADPGGSSFYYAAKIFGWTVH